MSEHHFHKSMLSSLTISIASLCISCERVEFVSAATQPAEVVEWDFSDGTDLERIKIPWTSPQEVQYVYGRKRLKLKARSGLSGEVDAEMIQVWRDHDKTGNVGLIVIFTASGTVEEVYANAMRLADNWHIKKRNNIERFRKTLGRTLMRDESVIVQDQGDLIQPRSINIRPSFEANEKKWLAILLVGFPALDRTK